MTILKGEWAFCPAGEMDDHDWFALEPRLATFDALIFAAARVDKGSAP